MDTVKTLTQSASRFFSGTALSRLTGLARDIAMAYVFGAQSSIAAFFVAFRLAHLFRRILGEGALQTAFIPKFEELRSDNAARACYFFIDLYKIIILASLAIILLSIGALGYALSFSTISEGNREIMILNLIMMPSLLFICLFGLNSSLLQCEKIYFIPSAAPVFFNLTWIAGSIFIAFSGAQTPIYWLAVVIIAASFAQWLATLPSTIKILRSNLKLSIRDFFLLHSKDLKLIGKPLFLGTLGVAASQINNALDSLFARFADSEGPALLWYAIRIQQVPLGLFAIAFSGALLPPLSRALKAGDLDKFYSLLKFSIKKCTLLMLACTAAILVFGKFGIRWIFAHGKFDAYAVDKTAECLYAYALGLIPMALVLVIAPAYYSRNKFSVPTAASIFSMFLNIVLNYLFVMHFSLGATSVALATAISAWVNYAILAWMIPKESLKIERI